MEFTVLFSLKDEEQGIQNKWTRLGEEERGNKREPENYKAKAPIKKIIKKQTKQKNNNKEKNHAYTTRKLI